MKLFGDRGAFCWLLLISVAIILFISQHQVVAESIAASEEGSSETTAVEEGEGEHHNHDHHEDHHEHDDSGHLVDEEVSTSGEDSSSHHHHDGHHSDVVHGHGESCGGDEAVNCNTAAGLICVEEVCECDKNAGEVYSVDSRKCEQTPPQVIAEVPDNSLEQQSSEEVASEEEKAEEEVQNDDPTTTTSTQPSVVVPLKDNSLETKKEIDYNLRPVQTIQHRTDEEGDHEHPEMTIHHNHGTDEVDHEHPETAVHHNHGAVEEEKSEEVESDEHEHESGPVAGGEGKCANVNCEESLGRYSKCDEETGECHCNDVEGLNRALIQKDDKCLIDRHINDPCSSHEDCTATIKGQAWCHMNLVTRNRFCQCEMFHYFDDSHKECLPFASEGIYSPCKTDMQCTGSQVAITGHGFGPNAKCNQEKAKCECKMGPDGQKGFLYENYCFFQLMPGAHCDLDTECEVSFPAQHVGCLEGQCMCKNGENITTQSCPLDPSEIRGGFQRTSILGLPENSDSSEDGIIDNLKSAMGLDVPNFVFIMIIGAVVLLAVVILSVFVVRKRHKYSMVRTREPTEEPPSPL